MSDEPKAADDFSQSSPPQTPVAPPSAPADDVGAPRPLPDPQLAERLVRADAAATEQFLAESKKQQKRRHGERGPDKRPRRARAKDSPLDAPDLAKDALDADLATSPPTPLAPELPVVAPFDEGAAVALVEIALGLLNDGAAALVTAIAKKETGDASLAKEAGLSVRMSEKIEATVKRGAIECARKYSVNLEYAPEVMLAGGLLIWVGQVSLSVKALKEKGVELRAAA